VVRLRHPYGTDGVTAEGQGELCQAVEGSVPGGSEAVFAVLAVEEGSAEVAVTPGGAEGVELVDQVLRPSVRTPSASWRPIAAVAICCGSTRIAMSSGHPVPEEVSGLIGGPCPLACNWNTF
jgi:hypothetical protein